MRETIFRSSYSFARNYLPPQSILNNFPRDPSHSRIDSLSNVQNTATSQRRRKPFVLRNYFYSPTPLNQIIQCVVESIFSETLHNSLCLPSVALQPPTKRHVQTRSDENAVLPHQPDVLRHHFFFHRMM